MSAFTAHFLLGENILFYVSPVSAMDIKAAIIRPGYSPHDVTEVQCDTSCQTPHLSVSLSNSTDTYVSISVTMYGNCVLFMTMNPRHLFILHFRAVGLVSEK